MLIFCSQDSQALLDSFFGVPVPQEDMCDDSGDDVKVKRRLLSLMTIRHGYHMDGFGGPSCRQRQTPPSFSDVARVASDNRE